MHWLAYPLLVTVLVLVLLQLIYSIALHIEASGAVMIAAGTQGACKNGKPLERETTRYLLHGYITSAGNGPTVLAQIFTFVVLVIALGAAVLVGIGARDGMAPMEQAEIIGYGIPLLLLLTVSLLLGFWFVPYHFGGGITKAPGFAGIPEYQEYHKRYNIITQWVEDNKDTVFSIALRERILARIQRYMDLNSRDQAEAIYDNARGRELMGYLIYENDSKDYPALYQAIVNSKDITKNSQENSPLQKAMAKIKDAITQNIGYQKMAAAAVAKVLGTGSPPGFTYISYGDPTRAMKARLARARVFMVILLLLVLYPLFHVMYERTPTVYVVGTALILFILAGTSYVYQMRLDIL